MYLLRKMSVFRMVLLLALTCSSATANTGMDRQFVDVISNDSKQYMVASIFQQEKPINRPLLKFENELRGGDDSKQSALLKEYYALMIQGQPKDAARLFFDQDGSKERYINSLLSMPTKYAGYTQLERIDFLTSFGWGPFQIFEVNLSGAKGRNMSWREAVICSEKKCFISNQIDQAESNINELSQIRRLLDTNAQVQAKLKNAFTILDDNAIYLPSGALQYSTIQNVQYPMVFSFQMESIPPVTIGLTAKTKTTASIKGTPLLILQSVFTELSALAPLVAKQSIKNQTDTDPEKSAAIEAYNQVINKYITDGASNNIYLYSVFATKNNKKREFRREWYHPIAAIQRISRWKSIKIFGYMPQGDNEMVVFFQPTSKDAEDKPLIEPMHAMAIESTASGPKLMLTDFKNNASQTINFAMEAPVVDVLGKKYADTPTLVYQL
jgi:hypothetical protein